MAPRKSQYWYIFYTLSIPFKLSSGDATFNRREHYDQRSSVSATSSVNSRLQIIYFLPTSVIPIGNVEFDNDIFFPCTSSNLLNTIVDVSGCEAHTSPEVHKPNQWRIDTLTEIQGAKILLAEDKFVQLEKVFIQSPHWESIKQITDQISAFEFEHALSLLDDFQKSLEAEQ